MNVLILSIHISHQHSQHWRQLQSQFIAETTTNYEYGVIVNGDNPKLYSNGLVHLKQLTSHRQAINVVLDIFRKHAHRFSHLLLLDSDCWPVRPDWQQILIRMMGHAYAYAAPIRTENFDNFPHPCAMFMKKDFLEHVDFDFKRSMNLLGVDVSDVGAAMPKQMGGHQVWYPLLKTNYISPHPVYASIYGDLFYHHCAGSRGIGFRSNGYKFYDHVIDRPDHRKIYLNLTTQLLQNPKKFISGLRGVNGRVTNQAVRS